MNIKILLELHRKLLRNSTLKFYLLYGQIIHMLFPELQFAR